jgi:septum site-determining protein MinC
MTNPFNEDEGFESADIATSGSLVGPQSGLPDDKNNTPPDDRRAAAERKAEERSSVITARGTAEGLVLRVDGRVGTEDLVFAVREFLASRRSFLSGNDIAFEWVGKRPEDAVIQNLTTILSTEFSVSVRASKMKPQAAPKQPTVESTRVQDDFEPPGFSVVGGGRSTTTKRAPSQQDKNVSLFDGIEAFESRSGTTNPLAWDDPDARIIYGTLRSGQKIETEHSIVVFGDVNSGAEVIAGGDVVILGTLRGIAHAGAYDESGGGRVIFSLNLRPTQLRIGLVISRGSGAEHEESTPRGGLPEVARVDGNMIVVEPYQSRTVWVRRRE